MCKECSAVKPVSAVFDRFDVEDCLNDTIGNTELTVVIDLKADCKYRDYLDPFSLHVIDMSTLGLSQARNWEASFKDAYHSGKDIYFTCFQPIALSPQCHYPQTIQLLEMVYDYLTSDCNGSNRGMRILADDSFKAAFKRSKHSGCVGTSITSYNPEQFKATLYPRYA